MSPIFLIGAGIVLLAVGLGLGYWFANSQRVREVNRASSIQKELDDYRRDVSRHFSDTAQHFQAIGQQYRALHKHMADGAQSLCDVSESDTLLGFTPDAAPAMVTAEPEAESEEVIRDYAPGGEFEVEAELAVATEEVEAIEAADVADEQPEEVITAVESTQEPAEIDVVAEPIVESDSAETERTVH